MGKELLSLYLDSSAYTAVSQGQHNFFGRVIRAVEGAGWRVSVKESTLIRRLEAPSKRGYVLYHMEEPTHDRALTCRRTYVGAFWHIEARAERWEWPVAAAHFDPDNIDAAQAEKFASQWRRHIWPDAAPVRDQGFYLVPLQGRLLDHRSFQAQSPIDMLRTTLARTDRNIIATLHPAEHYTDEEIEAVENLSRQNPRLELLPEGTALALRNCHGVITENSGVAMHAYFLHKPVILFAKSDFHHIAASVPRDGIDIAFAPRPKPQYDAYLYWFLQMQAINAGRPDCEERILHWLRGHGWPI